MERLNKTLFKDAFVVNLMFIGVTIMGYFLIVPGILLHITLGAMQVVLFLNGTLSVVERKVILFPKL